MELSTAIDLIKKGIPQNSNKEVWADLGAGKGMFTRALATLLGPGSIIYAIDRDTRALDAIDTKGPVVIKPIEKDFIIEEFGDPSLDGMLMANSLHFVADKSFFLGRLRKNLKEGGRLILVEYDMDIATRWVPYPISCKSLEKLAGDFGFASVTRIGQQPSLYNNAANLYSAVLAF